MKFRKKPVVIEAHRLGDDGWPDAIWEGVNANQIILHLGRDGLKRTTGFAEIHTMEGTMRADIGDYIIRGVKGEFYPCKPDIFAQTYEQVESAADAERLSAKWTTQKLTVRSVERLSSKCPQQR